MCSTMIELFSDQLPISETIRAFGLGMDVLLDPALDATGMEDVTALAIREAALAGVVDLALDAPQREGGLADGA